MHSKSTAIDSQPESKAKPRKRARRRLIDDFPLPTTETGKPSLSGDAATGYDWEILSLPHSNKEGTSSHKGDERGAEDIGLAEVLRLPIPPCPPLPEGTPIGACRADTLTLIARVEFNQAAWDDLEPRLKAAKRSAQSPPDASSVDYIEAAGVRLFVRDYHHKYARHKLMEYVLELDGIKVSIEAAWPKLENKADPDDDRRHYLTGEVLPPAIVAAKSPHGDGGAYVKIRVGQLACALIGEEEAIERVKVWLQAMGGQVLSMRVIEVDTAIDLPGVSMKEFQAIDGDHRICRAQKDAIYRNRRVWESLYIGVNDKDEACGGIRAKLYNKKQACIDDAKDGAEKWEAFVQVSCGGVEPDEATRVEFTTKGAKLKELFGDDSYETYIANRCHLARYLTHNWLRYADRPFDSASRNHSRLGVHPIWQRVQHLAATTYGLSEFKPDPKRVEEASKVYRARALVAAAKSYMRAMVESDGEEAAAVEALDLLIGEVLDIQPGKLLTEARRDKPRSKVVGSLNVSRRPVLAAAAELISEARRERAMACGGAKEADR